MTVADLIAQLRELDPAAEITVDSGGDPKEPELAMQWVNNYGGSRGAYYCQPTTLGARKVIDIQ